MKELLADSPDSQIELANCHFELGRLYEVSKQFNDARIELETFLGSGCEQLSRKASALYHYGNTLDALGEVKLLHMLSM